MENTTSVSANKLSPKFFFISVGVLIALATTLASFLSLVFDMLNSVLPDTLSPSGYASYDYASMRTSVAILVIMFPVFLVLSYVWSKVVANGLSSKDSTIKKWMLYLILFFLSLMAVIDLVTLVQYFISGEITTRFILKVLVIVVTVFVAGLYYVRRLSDTKLGSREQWGFRIVASVLVGLAIVLSFVVMGSPSTQRKLRFDEQRISDLESIQSQLGMYWQQKQTLPATLADLNNPMSGFVLPADPDTHALYSYTKVDTKNFQLCAVFGLASPDYLSLKTGAVGIDQAWPHGAGNTCFSRTIDPAMYPPLTKN